MSKVRIGLSSPQASVLQFEGYLWTPDSDIKPASLDILAKYFSRSDRACSSTSPTLKSTLAFTMSVEAMALPKPQSFEHKADVFDDGCAHDFNVDAMVFPALPDLPPFPESPWSGTNSESIEEHPSWDHEVVGATQLPKSQLSEIKGDSVGNEDRFKD
ncbi:hypothetical protein NA56DRAFT_700131 [Hyaloscypha hepaticicola]|uniref:Uncharacterized protein n=1 Tax=Hyaloscypha hepaticicola TaxID=2082293 RepID=A0A2J6QDZ6_9HELO|nr:hypothetical protein NA56DRAFT_700131 [Hyaloscypha hepaticicola]